MKFQFTDSDLAVLRNFARINPTQIVKPTGLAAREPSNSIAGTYAFENPQKFNEFAIYKMPDFLSAVEAFSTPELEVKNDHILITEGDSKIRYYTTPMDMVREGAEVPDLKSKFGKIESVLKFNLPADKLATIFKTASVLKGKFLFVEADGDAVRLTVSADKLESSANSFQVTIRDGIEINDLGDTVLSIPLGELRILPGDYEVSFATEHKVSHWAQFAGIDYFVGFAKD